MRTSTVRNICTTCMAVVLLLLLSAAAVQAHAQEKARVIVFVHGLHGDRETWVAPNGAYWPDMVRVDPRFAKSDVFVSAYPTPSSSGQYSTKQLAQKLWQQLQDNRVWNHREIVFIAHSLGGLITEEMLLGHPAEAAKTRFIVSYATPHEGSFVASFAKIYDSDPLLTDLSDSNDNSFLQNLEQQWRSTSSVGRIHRYCAYETIDTAAGEGIGKYLRAHTRVVSYYSATYGCDTDTPAQKINADHIGIVKPGNRNDDAYTFFLHIYQKNPIIDVVETTRDYKVPGLFVDCNRTNENKDMQVAAPLDAGLHEQVMSATAELVDKEKIRDVTEPTVVKIDPNGTAHLSYSFRGDGRGLGILGCPTGRATMLVHFKIHSEIPEKE